MFRGSSTFSFKKKKRKKKRKEVVLVVDHICNLIIFNN